MLFAVLDGLDLERLIPGGVDDGIDLVLGFKLKLLIIPAVKARREFGVFLAFKYCVEQPVFFAYKTSYLVFAVDYHSRCDRLHPSCGKAAADLLPKQRRELVADETVQQSARLLCIDKIAVNITGFSDALGDYLFCYFVKCNTSLLFHLKAQAAP